MDINNLWIVSVTVLNMCGISTDETVSKDFYFTDELMAIDCYDYYSGKKLVCGLSMDRFIDTIEINLDYEIK